jgi:TetR/AcrR family transcriptional repressor of nem operon
MAQYQVTEVAARSLALHAQAVLQGSFILAKATGGAEAAADSVAHLKRYFTLLFRNSREEADAK